LYVCTLVVDIVWHIELGQFLQESQMPHRVKRLAEVQGNDDDVTIGEEHAGHGVEWRREIIAAAGEPVGRKANWSENDRVPNLLSTESNST